jgi:hypothetical protein
MLTVGTYKTRDGDDVKIVAVEDEIAIGYIVKRGANRGLSTWRADNGRFFLETDEEHGFDLIDTKPRIKFERWATIYRQDGLGLVIGGMHNTIATAKLSAVVGDCIAIARVKIDCTEGENLD